MIEWNDGGSSKDDFTARDGGYCLRAEKMGKHWWWQVYYPDGSMANPGCDLDLPSERVAKRICEIIYELHRGSMTSDPDSHLTDPMEYLAAKQKRAMYLRGE